MQTEETAAQLAVRTMNDAVASIDTLAHPNYVRELVGAARGHVNDALRAGAQLEADRAELAAKRDLIPSAGAERLYRQALAEAEQKAKTSLDAARSSVEMLKRAGLLAAQPTIEPAREGLCREELSMLVGEGSPAEVMTRVHRIAQSGSRDAAAALVSPFGRSLLETRGLTGADLDDALSSAQKVIVETATDNASRHTDAELNAAKLYGATGDMEAAIGAASFALAHLGVSHA